MASKLDLTPLRLDEFDRILALSGAQNLKPGDGPPALRTGTCTSIIVQQDTNYCFFYENGTLLFDRQHVPDVVLDVVCQGRLQCDETVCFDRYSADPMLNKTVVAACVYAARNKPIAQVENELADMAKPGKLFAYATLRRTQRGLNFLGH